MAPGPLLQVLSSVSQDFSIHTAWVNCTHALPRDRPATPFDSTQPCCCCRVQARCLLADSRANRGTPWSPLLTWWAACRQRLRHHHLALAGARARVQERRPSHQGRHRLCRQPCRAAALVCCLRPLPDSALAHPAPPVRKWPFFVCPLLVCRDSLLLCCSTATAANCLKALNTNICLRHPFLFVPSHLSQ